MIRAAVIGGGVSGLAAAHGLAELGIAVEVFEGDSTLGGRVSSIRPDGPGGRWLDLGGKNIGRNYTRFRAFAGDYGTDWEPFGLSTSTLVGGRRVALSRDRPPLANLVALWRLCGPKGLAKLAPLAQAIRRDPQRRFLGSRHFDRLAGAEDPSLDRAFPRACVERFLRPLTIRMNGAEPEECHLGNLGSNLGLVLDTYDQPSDGMGALFERFAAAAPGRGIEIRLGHRVVALESPAGGPGARIAWESQGHTGGAHYDAVLLALPAHAAAALLDPARPQAAALLRAISYRPVAVAVARYERPVFRPECRALVFPRASPLSNAGAYGIHQLDLVRYTFSGAAARPLLAESPDGQRLADLAEASASPWVDLAGNRRLSVASRILPQGLCAYSPGHSSRLAAIRAATLWPGLALCGDYWRGASIEACFLAAEEAVAGLTAEDG